MATLKKGHLTTSGQWANHLRKLAKRWFWKGERRAAKAKAKGEARTVEAGENKNAAAWF